MNKEKKVDKYLDMHMNLISRLTDILDISLKGGNTAPDAALVYVKALNEINKELIKGIGIIRTSLEKDEQSKNKRL